MKAVIRALGLVCVLLGACSAVIAGDMYPVTLKGSVSSVNNGQIAKTPLSHVTMLQNIAPHAGIPASDLALVYHVGGNRLGDTIDVINRANGQVLDTLYGFYFGSDFARRALYSADGKDQRRLDYVYTHQAGVALGSAIVSKKEVQQKGGRLRLVINGSMQWTVMPQDGGPSQVCTAKFTTGPKLTW